MTTDFVLVLTTLPADASAASGLARTLVAEGFAACVNILPPMRSVYRWQGEIHEDDEHQLVIKTARTRVPALWTRLRELHSYDTPEFIVLPIVDGSDTYLEWIRESTMI